MPRDQICACGYGIASSAGLLGEVDAEGVHITAVAAAHDVGIMEQEAAAPLG